MEQSATRSPKYIAILAAVSSAILIVGWLARPDEIAQGPPPLPSENELAQLARRAERRSLDSMATYFAPTAAEVDGAIVRLPELAASGVAWDAGVIVTPPLPPIAARQYAVAWSSGDDMSRPAVWGPRLPLSTLATDEFPPGMNAARRAEAPPQPGAWVLAVWRSRQERGFAAGSYLQSAEASCGLVTVQEVVSSVALHDMMAGGGLFDIDGGLLGIILPCGERLAAVATASVATLIAGADTWEAHVLARYGLALGALTDTDLALFAVENGVMVREVWTGYRGDKAGVLPGDILREIDGVAVTKPDDARVLAEPRSNEPFSLLLQRGPKSLTVALPAAAGTAPPSTDDAPAAGLVLDTPPPGQVIHWVVPGSRAAAAGIKAGDRLVRIDRDVPRSAAAVQKLFAAARPTPVLLEVERDGRRLAILLR